MIREKIWTKWTKNFVHMFSVCQNLMSFHQTIGGPGKSRNTFSAERLPLSAPRQASVYRASRRGGAESGKQKMFGRKHIR
jgi:hypothetical protein